MSAQRVRSVTESFFRFPTNHIPKFYANDTCMLQGAIAVVDRTFGDVDTHQPDVEALYPQGISSFASIPESDSRSFLQTGIPPRGTALVTWIEAPGTVPGPTGSSLVPESDLELVDREIIVGDVVKQDPTEPMSGTVIDAHAQVYLLPTRRWSGTSTTTPAYPFLPNLAEMIGPINAVDLAWPQHYEVSDIVMYRNWIGRVVDCWQDVTVKLKNGTVVVPEIEEDIIPLRSNLTCEIGDEVKTKKANLRRGRWIFGAYTPNAEPEGYVLAVETTALAVDWLGSDGNAAGHDHQEAPPSDIHKELLEGGEITLYDSQRCPRDCVPGGRKSQQEDRTRLDAKVGDVVRFHDLMAASEWYNANDMLASASPRLRYIPRRETLGFDVNAFMVVRKETILDVRWQDLSQSSLRSTDVVPTLDLDDDDDVWPGELVCTRARKENDAATYIPKRVGVAQTVNAKDRVAQICWFEGTVSFPADDKSVLLPGSWTGKLGSQAEDMSLYDIWTVPALTRRAGDFVILHKFHRLVGDQAVVTNLPQYQVVEELLDDKSSCNFFGQVMSLNPDGTLTVRLGASSNVRDVRVPLECTHVVHATEWDNDPMEEDGESNVLEQAIALLGQPISQADIQHWHDENDEPLNDDDDEEDEWEDDEGQSEAGETQDQPPGEGMDWSGSRQIQSTASVPPTPRTIAEDSTPLEPRESMPLDHVSIVGLQFSYANMLQDVEHGTRPEAVKILEGHPPDDHHFVGSRSGISPSSKSLRRIQHEIGVLQRGLPEGVFVRTWEQAIDLFRVMILGPLDTPYEYVPIVIDIHLNNNWPKEPPYTFFHSWTDGSAPINPNLYEDGKICLSLLGTWPGEDKNQGWTPQSTMLQLVVSILGLVLVKEPYYNEAGFEVRAGAVEARIPSALYSERTYFRSRSFIKHALQNSVKGFEDDLRLLYGPTDKGPNLLLRAVWSAIAVLKRSSCSVDKPQAVGRVVSRGALIPLRRQILDLLAAVDDETIRSSLTTWIDCNGDAPRGGPGGLFDEMAALTDR